MCSQLGWYRGENRPCRLKTLRQGRFFYIKEVRKVQEQEK
jgi:hypothetical protein